MGEVDEAFLQYWRLGAVGEDWPAWAALFTDDALYVEHVLGTMHGRAEIEPWIVNIMNEYSELYTAYEWHMVEGNRVVVYMQNRRDDPDPSQPPIDFPGITILEYAGDGKWAMEEDYWSVPGARRAGELYARRCAEVDPDHAAKRTRWHWPDSPEFAKPASS